VTRLSGRGETRPRVAGNFSNTSFPPARLRRERIGLLGLEHPRKRQTGRKAGAQSYGPLIQTNSTVAKLPKGCWTLTPFTGTGAQQLSHVEARHYVLLR